MLQKKYIVFILIPLRITGKTLWAQNFSLRIYS